MPADTPSPTDPRQPPSYPKYTEEASAEPLPENARSKENAFYMKDLPPLSRAAEKLFKDYVGIEGEEAEKHIYHIRDQAWNIHPYPCIGQFRFLDLSIAEVPFYTDLLQRLQAPSNQILLDFGCCFGQDIRRLVADGAPSENLIGADLKSEFWDCGYDLFRDKESLKARFVESDVFDAASFEQKWGKYRGKIDMIHISSFLHLFGWDEQVTAAERLVGLLRRAPGSIIFGRQVGNESPGSYERRRQGHEGVFRWRHDPASFEQFWERIGTICNVKLSAKCEWDPVPIRDLPMEGIWRDGGARRLRFAVSIVA